MIFYSLNQLNCFLIFTFFGILFGIIYFILKTIYLNKIKKNYKKTIFLSIFYSIFSIFFVFLKNFYNFGIFSISLLFAFLIGYFLSKITIGNLVEFFQKKWYNSQKDSKNTMTNNPRIRLILIGAISLIVIVFALVIFQLVKIFQYEQKIDKLNKQIQQNQNIISYYENQEKENSTDDKNATEQIS